LSAADLAEVVTRADLLEETALPVESIAARVTTTGVNLRRRFRTQLGTTPSVYRRAFRVGMENSIVAALRSRLITKDT
jgi:transcriptional regulator GlxA family with amidase domain